MTISYLALGSNLNSPLRQIKCAIYALNQLPKTHVIKQSSIYLTKPSHGRGQPPYLNMVIEINTKLHVKQLLKFCQNIEHQQRRVRNVKNQARTIDIDVLLHGSLTRNDKSLIIPHPRMFDRDFVLVPLMEISSNIVLPINISLTESLKNAEKCILKKLK